MNANQLTQWILGALLTVLVGLVITVGALNGQRLDRIEANTIKRLDSIDASIAAIQAQYSKIAVIEQVNLEQSRQMDRIEKQLDALLRR